MTMRTYRVTIEADAEANNEAEAISVVVSQLLDLDGYEEWPAEAIVISTSDTGPVDHETFGNGVVNGNNGEITGA